jgi:hypothetical protein
MSASKAVVASAPAAAAAGFRETKALWGDAAEPNGGQGIQGRHPRISLCETLSHDGGCQQQPAERCRDGTVNFAYRVRL